MDDPYDIQAVSIKITSLNKEECTPNPSSGLWLMRLKLSSTPSADWTRFFEDARNAARDNKWRRAWIDGNDIVIECAPNEVGDHLPRLKEDVETANSRNEEAHLKWKKERDAEAATKDAERKLIDDIAKGLNFE